MEPTEYEAPQLHGPHRALVSKKERPNLRRGRANSPCAVCHLFQARELAARAR